MCILASTGLDLTSMPHTFMLPESGFSMPMMIFMVVLLPEPFGPRSPLISPGSTDRLSSLTAFSVPKDLETPVKLMLARYCRLFVRG